MILYQDCSSHLDSSKNMADRGPGLFFLYIYIENFKILLVRNQRTDFNIRRNVSLVTLYQDCSRYHDLSKHMAARERGLFSLYIYIENIKKIFLSETTGWISIQLGRNVSLVTLYQDCSSHHGLSKTWPLGAGLIFPIYLYRNL